MSGRAVVIGRRWLLSSGLGRPRDGPTPPHSLVGQRPRYTPSEPQPMTVSHDGGCADRPRTRVPRCTPTGLSHAANAVDQSEPRRPGRYDCAERSPAREDSSSRNQFRRFLGTLRRNTIQNHAPLPGTPRMNGLKQARLRYVITTECRTQGDASRLGAYLTANLPE